MRPTPARHPITIPTMAPTESPVAHGSVAGYVLKYLWSSQVEKDIMILPLVSRVIFIPVALMTLNS